MTKTMHPRIKAQYVGNLQEKRAQALRSADALITTFVARLEALSQVIDDVNATGNLTIPDDFSDYISNTMRTIQQLDLDSSDGCQRVKEMSPEVELVGQLLIASLRLQAAKQNIDLLQDAATQRYDQHTAPPQRRRAGF